MRITSIFGSCYMIPKKAFLSFGPSLKAVIDSPRLGHAQEIYIHGVDSLQLNSMHNLLIDWAWPKQQGWITCL